MGLIPRRPVMEMYQLTSGRRVLSTLDELNRTQWLSRDELLSLQRRKLHRLLTHAYAHVPYYRRLFDQHGFSPNDVLTGLDSFHRLPILTKEIIRKNQDAMLTTEAGQRARLNELRTSGSTGHPLIFHQDSGFRDAVTADIHRHLGWAGWTLGEVHCYIWGAHGGESTTADRVRTGLMNWTLNRFITDAYHLSDGSMAEFAAGIRRQRPRIIFAYPSSLYRFAQFVRERGMDDVRFDALFTSAEMIVPDQRRYIEETFGGRVFNRYGSRELGGISCECPMHTGMHISADSNLVEIVKDGRATEPGEIGDVIVTNLNNFGMPFIRYSIEDLGAWSTQDNCPCGRALPMMDLMQARRVEMFRTKNGLAARTTAIGPMFGMPGVKQFQIIQKTIDLIVVLIVRDAELDRAKLRDIESTLKDQVGGDVEVRFEFPDEIPVLQSGKYRYAFSEVRD